MIKVAWAVDRTKGFYYKDTRLTLRFHFDLFFHIRNFAKPMMLIGLKENQPGTSALQVEACF